MNELELEKCLLDKKQIQARNNVINDTYRMLYVGYVGRPLQRRWAHRWRKSHPNILQCMNRHCVHEVLTFWEHKFGICNQNESTPLGKALSRHTRAHNWHSYNEEKNKTVVITYNRTKALNRVWQYWHRRRKYTHTHTHKFYIYTQKPISISFH